MSSTTEVDAVRAAAEPGAKGRGRGGKGKKQVQPPTAEEVEAMFHVIRPRGSGNISQRDLLQARSLLTWSHGKGSDGRHGREIQKAKHLHVLCLDTARSGTQTSMACSMHQQHLKVVQRMQPKYVACCFMCRCYTTQVQLAYPTCHKVP